MRLKGIKCKFTFTPPLSNDEHNFIDRNGYKYSEDAIEEAVSRVDNIPLNYMDKNGEKHLIGNIESVSWDKTNQSIEAEGTIYFGGTCEHGCTISPFGIITTMEIDEMGIAQL